MAPFNTHRRGALASVASLVAGAALPIPAWSQASADSGVQRLPAYFDSGGVKLAGDLYRPASEPVAGIVLVHGSGRRTRIDWAAYFFAARGLAVLTYDKRGVGKSGGVFEDRDNASATTLALLAADAAAGMDFLRDQREMTGLKLGYWGISQAGWIIPLAAVRSVPPDFIALWSGPVCTVVEELEASLHGDGNHHPDAATIRGYIDYLRANGLDTDPRDSLRKMRSPGLWVYGAKDAAQPVQLSIERLRSLIGAGHSNFVYWLNSAGGHDDFEANGPLLEATAYWMLDQARQSPGT